MAKNPNLNPSIEEAMKLDQVSTRLLVEIYLESSLLPDTVNFAEQSFIHEETVGGKDYYIMKFIAGETEDLVLEEENLYYKSMDITRGELESSQDGTLEKVSLEMSNTNLGFASALAMIGKNLVLQKVILKEYFVDFPEEPPATFFSGFLDSLKMSISTFKFDVCRVLGSFDDEAPRMTYDPSCPFIFGDEFCGYAPKKGETCDKSLGSCENFGNLLNFGGHPSIAKEMVIR